MSGDYYIFGKRRLKSLDDAPALMHYHGSMLYSMYDKARYGTWGDCIAGRRFFLYRDESFWPDVTMPTACLVVPATWRDTLGPVFGGHLMEFHLSRNVPRISFPRVNRAKNTPVAVIAESAVLKAQKKDASYHGNFIKGDGPSWLDDPTSVGFRRHDEHILVETYPLDLLCGYPDELLSVAIMDAAVSIIKDWDYQEVVDSQGIVHAYSHYVATQAVFDLFAPHLIDTTMWEHARLADFP